MLAELASKYGVRRTMIAQWKRQAIEGMASIFSGKAAPGATASPADVEKLHAMIGQLLVECDFGARPLFGWARARANSSAIRRAA